MKPAVYSHPPVNVDVDLTKAIRIEPEGKEQKFIVKVNITPSVSQGVANPVWCIIWRGNPLVAIASYQDNTEAEFYFSSNPPPIYVTHWEQVGNSMMQLDINN